MARPPRFPAVLLALVLPRPLRDAILGDLAEEYCATAARAGRRHAAAAYWRQSTLIGASVVAAQMRRWFHDAPGAVRSSMTGGRFAAALLMDARYGLRGFRRAPAPLTIAILAMALGIGLTTAMTSVARTVFLAPMPFPDADRMGLIGMQFDGINEGGFSTSVLDMQDVAAAGTGIEALALFLDWQSVNLTGGAEPQRVAANFVTPNYFEMLGLRLAQGRSFRLDEDGAGRAAPVVVLSHALWHRSFGGQRRVVGERVLLNDRPFTVIGVLAADATDLSGRYRTRAESELYLPLMTAPQLTGLDLMGRRAGRYVSALVRWPATRSPTEIHQSLAVVSRRLATAHPESNRGWSLQLQPLRTVLFQDARGSTMLLLAGAGTVLLLVCANLVNLLLMQVAGRRTEFALRLAMGADRGRLVRQLLTETLALAAVGGAFGVAVALWGVSALGTSDVFSLPGFARPHIDARVLLVSLGLVVVAGLTTGAIPAWRAARANAPLVGDSTRQTSGGMARAGAVLVVAEVALACVLLINAGLLVQSFRTLRATGLGFDATNLLSMRLDLRSQRYDDEEVVRQTADRLLAAAAAIPGVRDAFLWSPSPLGGGNWVAFLTHPGQYDLDPLARVEASRHHIAPGALPRLGIALLAGRDFVATDAARAPLVAVVSESLARTFWPGESPVGRRLETRSDGRRVLLEVVGVAADARHRSRLQNPFGPQRDIYLPFAQQPERFLSLLVRPHPGVDHAGIVAAARRQVGSVDPSLPLYDVSTLESHMRREEVQSRLSTLLMTGYAGLALALAVLGVYGVLAHAVRLQRREIGIRLAIGARASTIVGSIVGRGCRLIVAGMALGLAAALGLARLTSSLLFGVHPHDGVVILSATLLIGGVSLLSCALPARTAAGVDPATTLRE